MPVIVTGAGGFVGRALVRRLLDAGETVVAVDSRLGDAAGHDRLRAVEGDLLDPATIECAFAEGCTALVHLATVPGGAAERKPALARRVNVDLTLDLIGRAAATSMTPRVVFASSIAVFGDALPPAGIDDATPVAPHLVYGGHKAMMEIAVATATNREEIDGVALRLPAILARPRAPSGMKSAFMSDIFHALRAGEAFVCPVSADATIWAQSIACCIDNLMRAVTAPPAALGSQRTVTLPALRVRMTDLAGAIARHIGTSPGLVRYDPDPALEAAFGAQPPLVTSRADAAGFRHDGDVGTLVARALAGL